MDKGVGKSDETDRNSGARGLGKLNLPTPTGDGEILQWPASGLQRLWDANRELARHTGSQVQWEGAGCDPIRLVDLRLRARRELLDLAVRYSRRYGDFSCPTWEGPVVMAGHQPELFHTGVWYKNFVLSKLGQRFSCPVVNLVVDNDHCSRQAIQVPIRQNGQAQSAWIPYDLPATSQPYETRNIADVNVFREFESRVAEAIKPMVSSPLIQRFWPHVLESASGLEDRTGVRLGAALAAGRHRLESELGLNTLEVPVSQLCDTESFRLFLKQIVARSEAFRRIHNQGLEEYRIAYGIRSRSHPVPELERREQWDEIPFWVWNDDSPTRRRLFVQDLGERFVFSDGAKWQLEISESGFLEKLEGLEREGVRIRPRALMTTLYCRMVLSDLFVHGIGGAKYDQLTDLIAERFWGCSLPDYCVASATFRLPSGATPPGKSELAGAKQTVRQLDWNPERFIDLSQNSEARMLVQKKRDWIQKVAAGKELSLRHREIERCNEKLRTWVKPLRQRWSKKIGLIEEQLAAYQILGSREFSFCLFPESLTERLMDSAIFCSPKSGRQTTFLHRR